MDTARIEYFLRVAELGSINRAASDLHVSQPALSRQLQLLEAEMGVPLLVRKRTGVRLTEAGSLLFDRARAVLRDWATLQEQVSGVARGQVAVGFPHSWRHIAAIGMATALIDSQFINARVNESISHDLLRQLADGLLDVCIAPDDGRSDDNYIRVPLARDPLMAVGDSSREFLSEGEIGLEELEGHPLILLARPTEMRSDFEHQMAVRGLRPTVVLETDSLPVCFDLVSKGRGLSVLPACALVGAGTGLRSAPLRGLSTSWAIFVNVRRTHSEAVRFCVEQILRITEEAVRDGRWPGAVFLAGSAGRSDVEDEARRPGA